MKREITLNNISVGAYMRHFHDDGACEYVEFNDTAKAIFGSEDVLNSPYWRQELEDINDANVIKSDKPYVIDYPVVDDYGQVHKWLAFTKNKVCDQRNGTFVVTTVVDETQRKLNEELIEEQNSLMEAMYKYLPVGVARMDLSGRVLFANDRIVSVLGIENAGEIIGKVIFNDPNFPPNIKERILSFENNVTFQASYDFNLITATQRYRTSNKSIKILKHKYSTIYNNSGTPTGFLGITEDVTEEENRKEALSMTQKNLSLVLENGKMSTWNYDVEEKMFTVFNGLDSTKNRISYDEHFDTLLFPEYLENSKNTFDNVVIGLKEKGGSVYKTHDPITGKTIFRKTSFIGVKKNGVVTNVIGTSHDVTDLYIQQEELIKSKNELNLALEAGDISAWTYDVDKQRFSTLYGNAIAGKGLSLEEAELLHPDDKDKMMGFLEAIIDGSSTHVIDIFRFKADVQGGYRYYDSRIVGTLENGRITVITGTQKDVTEDYLHKLLLEEYALKTNLINSSCNIVQFDYDFNKHAIHTYSDNSILPGQDITLEKYLEFVHPDDRERVRGLFQRGDNKEFEKFSINMRLLLPNAGGEYKPVISDGVALKNAEGKIIKYTGIRRDMSEWEELNSQLKEQNTINKLIIDNINVGLTFFDSHCKVRWTNFEEDSAMLKFMGIKPHSSGSICQFLVGGKCKSKFCLVRKAIRDGISCEKELSFKTGEFIEATANPVYDDNDEILGSILKFRDITEKKNMDLALNKAKEDALVTSQILNIILARIPGALFIKDATDDFKYFIANDQYLNTLGKTASEVIGKTDFDIYDKKTAELFRSFDVSLLEGSSSHSNYESKVPVKGKDVYWQISKSMMRSEDGRYLILGAATDITDIKETNIELNEAKRKAEESDTLKSAFLANMSHEIRTPLNAIVGFSDLLTETDDIDEKSEYCKIITSNSEMLLRLIGDILDLSKIESGNTEFKRQLVDISAYFDEITSSLGHREENPKVKFIIENPYKTCYVRLDKERFGQIITNFVTNSIKYTPSGYIKVGYNIENNGVKIYVEDTGVGIPEEKRDRVFNRFDKLDSFAQGTGLGLTIVKALTEESGGKCGFDSIEGKGSTFWAWKPFPDIRFSKNEKTAEDVIETRDKEENSLSSISEILVAEDNESNFILIRSILKDYNVSWATNGADAVEKASKKNFDVILMDIKMPIMDGLEATREIRKFNNDIPIIAVTANAFQIALKAGCSAFLPKPIKKAELLKAISKCQSAAEK